jgi:mono/diheme cytochrome c family protein
MKRWSVLLLFVIFSSGAAAQAPAGERKFDPQLLERGKNIWLTVAGVGCVSCHGKFGEGDVGVGPYNRGVGLSKIASAIEAVDMMRALFKDKLSQQDIEAVAAYTTWMGQHQLIRTLVKRDRFLPDAIDVYPGTAVQLVVRNTSQVAHRFVSPNMNVAEFQVAGRDAQDLVWRAPETEGSYTMRCVDCVRKGEESLTINVRRSARRYRVPDPE